MHLESLRGRCPDCDDEIIVCANGYLDTEPTDDRYAFGVMHVGPLAVMVGGNRGPGPYYEAHEHQPGGSE